MGKVKKRWLPEEIAQAKQLIAEGSSLRKVSKVSGIPKETLRRHVSRPYKRQVIGLHCARETKSNSLLMPALLLHLEIQ